MTIKVDGTNGVLQAYDFQVLTTGFSYTFAAGTTALIANPAGTLATGTITMPAAPADGMVITIQSTQQITALTVQGNTGQSLVGGAITMRANQPESFIYRLTNTTWYPFAGAANTQIISGTAVASTSGTSIDFTSIPSWVKRITVMFQGVSTSGSSVPQIRLGSGSVDATGYTQANGQVVNAGATVISNNPTTGFGLNGNVWSSGVVIVGKIEFVLLNSSTNLWVATGVLGRTDSGGIELLGGAKTLSGVLDRIRITTVNGTDTFTAGSINILYE
jgi:hypothetical protein